MKNHQAIIRIHWIQSEDQIADIFTKPLGKPLHEKFTINILGWDSEDLYNQSNGASTT